jgi:hypothetical protein
MIVGRAEPYVEAAGALKLQFRGKNLDGRSA